MTALRNTCLRRTAVWLALALPVACLAANEPNYDEAKVGSYLLPDPLVMQDGTPVHDAKMWMQKRRPEILRLFRENVYGRSPGKPPNMSFDVFDVDKMALGGKAERKQITVFFSGKKDGPQMDILLYTPADATKPVPVFLCLSFTPNYQVNADAGIRLKPVWNRKTGKQEPPVPADRGRSASRWKIEETLAHGYGIAIIDYNDIEPDFDGGMKYGVRPLFFKPGQTEPADDDWGAIGAWAWGASRALDYLLTDKDVDGKRVIMFGQSRLGKTALWAGAQDTRFAMVIACNSGEGGASLMRRRYGETVNHLAGRYAYQFCRNFKRYADNENALPVDAHELLALIAPRPLYLSTASLDLWSDPRGEFLAAVAAGPVFRLLGAKDLGTVQMPPLDHPIMHTIAFHCHTGKHEVTPFDWEQFFTFAGMHFKASASDAGSSLPPSIPNQ